MALSLQEISDRLELQDLVTQYADIIDRKAFSELKTLFTDDAVIDYEATGAIDGMCVYCMMYIYKFGLTFVTLPAVFTSKADEQTDSQFLSPYRTYTH